MPDLSVMRPHENGITDAGHFALGVRRQVVTKHLEQANQQVTAGNDSANAIELGNSLVAVVWFENATGNRPHETVLADTLTDTAAIAFAGVGRFALVTVGLFRRHAEDGHITPPKRVAADAKNIVNPGENRSFAAGCPLQAVA